MDKSSFILTIKVMIILVISLGICFLYAYYQTKNKTVRKIAVAVFISGLLALGFWLTDMFHSDVIRICMLAYVVLTYGMLVWIWTRPIKNQPSKQPTASSANNALKKSPRHR